MPKNKKKLIYRRQKLLNLVFGFFISLAVFSAQAEAADEINKPAVPIVTAGVLRPTTKQNSKTNLNLGLKAEWPAVPDATEYQYMVTQTSQHEGYDVVGTAIYRDWTSVNTKTNIGITDLNLMSVGPYTISVRAKNSQGVWSDSGSSNPVYLDTIGQEGGQVSSSDNKATLIIPPGALTQAERISLESMSGLFSKTTHSTPQDDSLGVIEFRPAKLSFNPAKPATLIYAFSQAQVPGTPIQLGFYEFTKRGTMATSSQIGSVAADGYTVRFELPALSSRASLKSMATQGTPIGAGVKIPLPDMFTGSFSHSIPITVPPGRKGVQPNLGLTYRSSNPNSWVGVGFSLNPGYIVRSTRLGPPKYIDTEDTFYFISDAGTTELVHLIDNVYQARIESSFAKFYKEAADDSWQVVNKDGSILRFGQSEEAKEKSTRGTFSWALTRLTDNNGNYIQFEYAKDSAADNKSYLKEIKYTGNENAHVLPTNTVSFILESRSDIPSSYISGSKIATSKRLKTIEAKVNLDLVWIYDLVYQDSPDTNRSLLKSITQRAGLGEEKFPTQEFTYKRATK